MSLEDEIKHNERVIALLQIGYEGHRAENTAESLAGLSDLAFMNLVADIRRRKSPAPTLAELRETALAPTVQKKADKPAAASETDKEERARRAKAASIGSLVNYMDDLIADDMEETRPSPATADSKASGPPESSQASLHNFLHDFMDTEEQK